MRGANRSGLGLQYIFVGLTRLGATVAMGSVLVGLGVAWLASYIAGGSHTALPHLFYVPIVLAAVRFSWAGAVGSAVGAGVLAGPLLPADVAAGSDQPLGGWLLRLVIFVGIGLFVAWLARDSSESIPRAFQDAVLSGRLLQGIERGEVHVVYQPIVDMKTGRITAVEALARWTQPRHGEVSPGEFIPVAERTGAVAALDRFVLKEAVNQVQCWSTPSAPLKVSVNVSATRFAQDDLVENVEAALTRSGLPGGQLQLEITESALIHDVSSAAAQIARVRALGVRVAVDDFGAGHASLSYLDSFAIDTVKIDRSLTSRVVAEPRTARLVSGIIHLFASIDLEVVGEGIETAEDYVHMQSLGCLLGQGFYIGRPVPAEEMADKVLQSAERASSTRSQVETCSGHTAPTRSS
ncbi:MAG TPA: EAL domain-containing protein [Nocardioidaceae bacterium]|nr:EAL domain-containing protein [Nocardioidaceae bacterium]